MQIKVKNCRLSFADIRKPYKSEKGEAKYTFNGICSDDTTFEVTDSKGVKKELNHKEFIKVVNRLCTDKWGKIIPPALLLNFAYNRADTPVGTRSPKITKDGEYYEGYEADTMYFSASTSVENAPKGILIIDQKKQPLDATTGKPVNGDYVNAIIDVYAFEYENKKGISASIGAIQYLRKGEPFGSNVPVDPDQFDEELVDEDEDAPETGDLDEDDCI
jgi:hypothetical protein